MRPYLIGRRSHPALALGQQDLQGSRPGAGSQSAWLSLEAFLRSSSR